MSPLIEPPGHEAAPQAGGDLPLRPRAVDPPQCRHAFGGGVGELLTVCMGAVPSGFMPRPSRLGALVLLAGMISPLLVAVSVDPTDDSTFWYTTEYYDTTSSFNWRTRIASFKIAAPAGENIVLTGRARTRGTRSTVTLTWTPAVNDGNINIMRDGVVVKTTADTGTTKDSLQNASGTTHAYQVCETDGGGCSNTVNVVIP